MASNKEFLDDDILYDDSEADDLKSSVSEVHKSKPTVFNEKPSQVIKTTPVLEVKQIEQNPYAEKYNKNPSKQKKKRQLKQDIAVKKLISISQKNMKVVEILKNIPNTYPSDSEYICQAIIEKYERENKQKNTDIKSLVKDALEELVGDKYIIMKGSSDIQVTSQVTQNSNINNNGALIDQNSINKAIASYEEEEKESLLLGIIDDMDDD
jgi:hypothetical protein